jgi:hypothetical protein
VRRARDCGAARGRMAQWQSYMHHLEPRQPKPRSATEEPPRKKSLIPLAAVVLAIALAGGYGLTRHFAATPVDAVTQQEQTQRMQDFRRMAPLKVAPVPADRVRDAVTSMNLSAPDEQALRNDLQAVAGPGAAAQPAQQVKQPKPEVTRLIELVLWDSQAPDGDIVRLSSGGFTREVILAKSPTIVYMPYSGSGGVQVTGVHDGGGGITLGIKGSETSVMMPVLSVGQAITLPVRLP